MESARNDDEPPQKKKKVWSYSEDAQQLIINCHKNLALEKRQGSIARTAKLLEVDRNTVRKCVDKGEPRAPKTDSFSRESFQRVDSFTKDLIRRIIYGFYDKKVAPTLDMVFDEVMARTEGTEYPFPYCKKTLGSLLKKLGFRYCKVDNRTAIMESGRIVNLRYQFLTKIRKLRAEGYKVVYMDETWYDTHDTAREGWSDNSAKCYLNNPVSRGKRIVICHAGSEDGFVHEALFLCCADYSNAYADYHKHMDGETFEQWFRDRLLPNLSSKTVIVLDNASYHSRVSQKIPTQATRKADILLFMKDHTIAIPQPIPFKPVLLHLIKAHNIKKAYIIDNMAEEAGHRVLRLPPYHCNFNAIEMVWGTLKMHIRRQNIYTAQPLEVVNLIKKVCDTITPDDWKKYIDHVIKEENQYWDRDHIVDEEIDPFIITFDDESDDEFFSDSCAVDSDVE